MKSFDLTKYEGKQKFYQWSGWKRTSENKKCKDPLCEMCLKKGILTPAEDVHHIISLDKVPTLENALDPNNLMSLCKSCHSIITQQENKDKKRKISDVERALAKFVWK